MTVERMRQEFGRNLEWWMKYYQISQKQLAEDLGVSLSTINQYLNGKQLPSAEMIVNILYVIGCKFEDLFDTEEMVIVRK